MSSRMASDVVQVLQAACRCAHYYRRIPSEGRCLLHVASAIVRMISILSMTNDLEINPIAIGVRGLYELEAVNAQELRYLDSDKIETSEALHFNVRSLFSTSTTMMDHPQTSPSAIAGGWDLFLLWATDRSKTPANLGGPSHHHARSY